MTARSIHAQYAADREDVGDLVTRRPVHPFERLNPFLFINHHGPQVYPPHNSGLPFGPHPHRGFETVTFIVDGSLVHRDSGGHESAISAGGVQWMTAGSGVEHSETSPEEFLERGGGLEILQLWVNLPARLKMSAPRYLGFQRDHIPAVPLGPGATAQLIAGTLDQSRGPVESLTGVVLMTVTLAAGAEVSLDAPRGRVVFFYVVRGAVNIGGEVVDEFHLTEMNDDGDTVSCRAESNSLVIFGHAEAIDEPIYAHGPFVMNTRDEILQAVRDYQSGKFGQAG